MRVAARRTTASPTSQNKWRLLFIHGHVVDARIIVIMIYMTILETGVMSKKKLSVAEVKATFSACVRRAEAGRSLLITRHGKAVAALVRAEDLEQLERLRAAGPEGGLTNLVGGWEGSDELVDVLHDSRRSAARDVPSLG